VTRAAYTGAMAFIVRASLDERGCLVGVVTDTTSGRRERFQGAVELGEVITAMAAEGGRDPQGLAGMEPGLG
jgi:hypothetical protein